MELLNQGEDADADMSQTQTQNGFTYSYEKLSSKVLHMNKTFVFQVEE